MTHLSENLLQSYLADELDDDKRVWVDAHLDACDACVDRLADVAAFCADDPLDHEFELLLEQPPVGFADRVMNAVMESASEEQSAAKVVPFPTRHRFAPRLEVFTRFVTAAVVTGFMMVGSYQAAKVEQFPVVGTLQSKVEVVTNDTAVLYLSIHTWFQDLSSRLSN